MGVGVGRGPPGAHCLQLVCGLIQYLCLPLERDGKSSKEEIKTTHRSECGSDWLGNQKTPALLRLRFERGAGRGAAAGTGTHASEEEDGQRLKGCRWCGVRVRLELNVMGL